MSFLLIILSTDIEEKHGWRYIIDYRVQAVYAVFHAMRAVLILDGFDSKKYSGIISEFQRLYIKTGIFAKETSNSAGNLMHKASNNQNIGI